MQYVRHIQADYICRDCHKSCNADFELEEGQKLSDKVIACKFCHSMSLSLKATKDEIIVRKLNQLEKDFIREATMRLAVNEPDTKQVVQEAIELAMEIDRQCGPVFEKEKMFDKNYRDIN